MRGSIFLLLVAAVVFVGQCECKDKPKNSTDAAEEKRIQELIKQFAIDSADPSKIPTYSIFDTVANIPCEPNQRRAHDGKCRDTIRIKRATKGDR